MVQELYFGRKDLISLRPDSFRAQPYRCLGRYEENSNGFVVSSCDSNISTGKYHSQYINYKKLWKEMLVTP